MSESNSDAITRNPKTTFLTATSTGFITLSSFLPDKFWSKVCELASPIAALAITILLRNGFHRMQCHRGIKTYKALIKELEEDFNKATTSKTQKAKILLEIQKLREDIIKLKKDNIKIIIH